MSATLAERLGFDATDRIAVVHADDVRPDDAQPDDAHEGADTQ